MAREFELGGDQPHSRRNERQMPDALSRQDDNNSASYPPQKIYEKVIGKDVRDNPHYVEDFSKKYVEVGNNELLLVDAAVVAASKWENMIALTQGDFRERGVVVSRKKNGKLVTSKILEGFGEERDEDDPSRKFSPAFVPPLFPHGMKSLVGTMEDLVLVHSHPMPPEIDHLRTTILSDSDIHSFLNTSYRALVMVDRGGAHILVRTKNSLGDNPLAKRNIVAETMKSVTQAQGGALDVITSLATELPQYGLGYFYTPTEQIDAEEKSIRFQNPRTKN